MSDSILKEEERLSLGFRSLYEKYGYLPYKMSKFEEYDLYVANKEFLAGEGVVTFHDTDGKLLALKPDVTLSIIKNDVDGGHKRKLYYDENVYRISAKTKRFKEIRQVGLECLGDVDLYDVYETVELALQSLASVSGSFALELSHLGISSAILKGIGGGEEFETQVAVAIGNKNAHETVALCEKYGVAEGAETLLALLSAYGDMSTAMKKIAPLCKSEAAKGAYEDMQALCQLLEKNENADKICLDFSALGDRNYYDDVVFKGFIEGVGECVLVGGRYDRLLTRMGRSSSAIGFAVYLDALEGFGKRQRATDVDVLLLYGDKTDAAAVVAKVQAIASEGKSVRAQKEKGGVRYGEVVDLRGGKV